MRYWTETEARAELPRLRMLIDAIRQGSRQGVVARSNGHAIRRTGDHPAEATATATAGAEPGIGDTVNMQAALAELHDKGIVLRDADTGLVDFPAVTDGGVVYLLCWKSDEDDLEWWHFAEEGVAGRKRLPLPPDL